MRSKESTQNDQIFQWNSSKIWSRKSSFVIKHPKKRLIRFKNLKLQESSKKKVVVLYWRLFPFWHKKKSTFIFYVLCLLFCGHQLVRTPKGQIIKIFSVKTKDFLPTAKIERKKAFQLAIKMENSNRKVETAILHFTAIHLQTLISLISIQNYVYWICNWYKIYTWNFLGDNMTIEYICNQILLF